MYRYLLLKARMLRSLANAVNHIANAMDKLCTSRCYDNSFRRSPLYRKTLMLVRLDRIATHRL